jgi:hypothetical protein
MSKVLHADVQRERTWLRPDVPHQLGEAKSKHRRQRDLQQFSPRGVVTTHPNKDHHQRNPVDHPLSQRCGQTQLQRIQSGWCIDQLKEMQVVHRPFA